MLVTGCVLLAGLSVRYSPCVALWPLLTGFKNNCWKNSARHSPSDLRKGHWYKMLTGLSIHKCEFDQHLYFTFQIQCLQLLFLFHWKVQFQLSCKREIHKQNQWIIFVSLNNAWLFGAAWVCKLICIDMLVLCKAMWEIGLTHDCTTRPHIEEKYNYSKKIKMPSSFDTM